MNRGAESKAGVPPQQASIRAGLSEIIAVAFVLVILAYAASGPISEFVRWFIETTTPGFDELSRRDKRILLREHWLGGSHRSFERRFMLPTGLILGLPILFSFTVTLLTLDHPRRWRWLNWPLTLAALAAFSSWVIKIFATDGGALPSADPSITSCFQWPQQLRFT